MSNTLARTRDKRSVKVPVRFDDFSDVSTFRSVAEALKSKTKSKRPSSPGGQAGGSRPSSSSSSSVPAASTSSRPTTPASTTPVFESEPSPTGEKVPSDKKTSDKTTPERKVAEKIAPTEKKADKRDIRESGNDDQDEQVIKIWKGPFHPTVTLRKSNVKFDESSSSTPAKPLVEQTPNTHDMRPTASNAKDLTHQSNNLNTSKISTSRKKSKGFSLMVKPKDTTTNTSPSTPVNVTKANNNIYISTSKPSQVGYQNFPGFSKYINALNDYSLQYGTGRYLLNEPIHLPRTVDTIGPITTTLQQIANQARKPPFLTKRAEAFIKYQDDRKLNYLASSHNILVKITQYLGVKDKLNLRCVDKTWRSIIDSEVVWKKVLITDGDEKLDWTSFQKLLMKYKTTDLNFIKYNPGHAVNDKAEKVSNCLSALTELKRVSVRSDSPYENSFAFMLFKNLSSQTSGLNDDRPRLIEKELSLRWYVRVGIDDSGIATVEMSAGKNGEESQSPTMQEDKIATFELYDLEKELIEHNKLNDEINRYENKNPLNIDIKPI